MGSPRTFRDLANLVNCFQPQILFLSETKKDTSGMEFVKVHLRYHNCLTVMKGGRSGGLTCLWSEDLILSNSSYSSSHIDALIHDNGGKIWMFMRFYRNPSTACRAELWNLLRSLSTSWCGP